MDAFRGAGATSSSRAHRLADLDLEEDWLVERLVNRQVLRQAEPGTYYLDEEGWQALRRTRGRRLIIAAVIILLIGLGLLLVKVFRPQDATGLAR